MCSSALNDLIQSFGQCVPCGRFTLMNRGEVGTVHVAGGIVTSAQMGAAIGVKALVRMAAWKNGNFEFKDLPLDHNYTIKTEENLKDYTILIFNRNGDVVAELKGNGKGEFIYRKLGLDHVNMMAMEEETDVELEDAPEIINESAEEKGWICKISGVDAADLEGLMTADAYKEFVS